MKRIILSVVGALLIVCGLYFTSGHIFASETFVSQAAKPHTKIFTGTVIKKGDMFVLNDAANKLSYTLDDAQRASEFEGKKVKVTGTVDVANNTIHVENIEEIV